MENESAAEARHKNIRNIGYIMQRVVMYEFLKRFK